VHRTSRSRRWRHGGPPSAITHSRVSGRLHEEIVHEAVKDTAPKARELVPTSRGKHHRRSGGHARVPMSPPARSISLFWTVLGPLEAPKASQEEGKRGAIGLTQQMGAGTQQRCTGARPLCLAHGSRATRLRGSSGHCGSRRPLDRHDSGSNTFHHLRGGDRNKRHALERIRAKLVPKGLHVSR